MSAELPHQSAARTMSVRDPASTRVGGWQILWILTAIVGLTLFARDLFNLHGGLSIGGETLWGRDFVNVYSSGALVLQGRLDILYDVAAYRAFQLDTFAGALDNHNYSYPPATLLYTWLFALLPYPVALAGWLAGTAALFARAAKPYLTGVGLPAWLAIAAPASVINL
ncbi:MAG: hypothetical protein ACXWUX_01965, partial [Allosphingosinicella sp.]